ncbi:Twinfilin-1 [Puttea exsequens]|nr:Twinfilin-1 [Puttea exsequens]
MQSGISVSAELQSAFNELVSSPTQRGLIATITSESLTPVHSIPAASTSFHDDLPAVKEKLAANQAAYIILRRYQNAPDGYVAVTYIPDSAPVRQKMLFASTRLTLVRELGKERFRELLFVTELKELDRDGWEKHEASGALKAPLTEEERTLQDVKEAEEAESRGTAGRRLVTGGHLSLKISEEARGALRGFLGGVESLLMLGIDVNSEEIELAGTSETDAAGLASAISSTEPRYSFFKYKHGIGGEGHTPIVFIYTCPSGSKIKERMIYASTKRAFLAGAQADFGIEIAKGIEASAPEEVTIQSLEDEFRPKEEAKQGFSRPKRPGKR